MLHLNDITIRVAGRPLLQGASLHLPAGSRTALVGRNGTGKSTLLRLIAGEIALDAGEMRLRARARIGVVAQEAPGGRTTPLDAVLAADTERAALMAESRTVRDPHRIAEVHTRLAEIGAEAAPARAARILKGLGFDDAAQLRPLGEFSGGWRMRVALAAVLFAEPDLLLLDEPTNHLDLEASIWLEGYLQRYPKTLLVISHDRDVLNAVPQRICHLEGGKLTVYNGNYDQFDRQRRERLMLQEKTRQKVEAQRAHLQAFVDRFRYKASKARQAQSRLKMIARLEPISAYISEPSIRFAFPASAVPPPPLVTMDRAAVGYDTRPVLERLELRIDPDDRIALLGRNGNGKSTFAKLVAGRLEPLEGEVTRARGLKIGFFAQHQIEDLDPDASAYRHVERRLPQARPQQIRERLARFGLGAERVETEARHLSGGERTRLCLALMCLEEPNLLILDEPTNHLDIDSRESLIEAVNEFPGAVILISHDRHLVELIADRLWLVAEGRVRPFEGDVEDYRRLLLETSGDERRPDGPGRGERLRAAERRSLLAPLRKEARAAERALERLAHERERLEGLLAAPAGSAGNGLDAGVLQKRVAELAREMAHVESRWLELEGEIEALEAS